MILGAQLSTPRLIVRPFAAADAARLVAIFADPLVHRFVDDGLPLPPAKAALWIERSAENLARHGYGTGAVIERAGGQVIGWAGFARPGDGSEEIVYGFQPAFWNKGFGTELLAGLIAFAEARGLGSVRATVDPANLASVHLLRQAGFVRIEAGYRGDAGSDLYIR